MNDSEIRSYPSSYKYHDFWVLKVPLSECLLRVQFGPNLIDCVWHVFSFYLMIAVGCNANANVIFNRGVVN